jgi:ribonuclease BN (tRNA processing enzyme)
MKIKVLGASGSVGQEKNTATFLLDDFLLLDAGSVSRSLSSEAQNKISHIFLSHAHLDHIKSIPFFIDNINIKNRKKSITIYSGREVIADLRKHIFNNRIWPDFSVIPSKERGLIRYHPVSTRGCTPVGKYRVYASKVSHTVPAYGFLIEDPKGRCLVYSGDSGPTEKIWRRMKGRQIKALIIEVSFPNAWQEMALLSGHLTPGLLKKEIQKMPVVPDKIYITHLKKGHSKAIKKELEALKGVDLEILYDGMEIKI